MHGASFDGLKISEPLNPHSLIQSKADTNYLGTPADKSLRSGKDN